MMMEDGFYCRAPNMLAEEIDKPIAESMKCRKCRSKMRYEPWTKPGSYIALAVCPNCGAEIAF